MANGYGGAMLGATASECAAQECESQKIVGRVIEHFERVKNSTRRIRMIGDRLVGERGEPEGKNIPRPIRSGAIGKLHDQLDDLDIAMRELEDMVVRIEGV